MNVSVKKILKNLYLYKTEYDGAMVIFRAGDFYEMYGKDAEKASEILGIYKVDRKAYCLIGFPKNALDEYLPKLIRNGYKVVIADMIDIEDDDTPSQVNVDSIETHGFDCKIKESDNNDNKPTNNTNDMNEKTINNIKMGIATETIKALKGELPATLADYLYDAIGKLEVIKIKHKLNLTPNRSEIAYLIEQAEINRGE